MNLPLPALAAALVLTLATASAAQDAATAPEPASGDQMLHVVYDCPQGGTLEAVFINTEAGASHAVVSRGEGLIAMSIAVSASGARYTTLDADNPVTFWTKGDTASLYEGPEETPVLVDCTAR